MMAAIHLVMREKKTKHTFHIFVECLSWKQILAPYSHFNGIKKQYLHVTYFMVFFLV